MSATAEPVDPIDSPEYERLDRAHQVIIDRLEAGKPTGFATPSMALAAADWLRGEAIGLVEIVAWVELHQAVVKQIAEEQGREYVALKVFRDERGRVQYRADTHAPALRLADAVLDSLEAS